MKKVILKRPKLNLRPRQQDWLAQQSMKCSHTEFSDSDDLSKEFQTLYGVQRRGLPIPPLSALMPSSQSTGEKVQTKGDDETIVFTNLAAESDGSAEETM